MNSHPASPARAPDATRIDRFLRGLAAAGTTVTLRRPRGVDIDAACGQLALARPGLQDGAHTGRRVSLGSVECSTR